MAEKPAGSHGDKSLVGLPIEQQKNVFLLSLFSLDFRQCYKARIMQACGIEAW